MALLQPDASIAVSETGRKCRLGLIARDGDGQFWGLTAAHPFEGVDSSSIANAAGEAIGRYESADNQFHFEADDARGQIVRFRLDSSTIAPDRINYGVTWPREAIEERDLLGTKIITIEQKHREIGRVAQANSIVVIGFRADEEPATIRGAIIVALADASIIRPGQSGRLLLSEGGEAVALGIATQTEGANTELVGSPLRPFLERAGLRPWAPSGAHWTDLRHRVKRFLTLARAHPGPDLGAAPPTSRS